MINIYLGGNQWWIRLQLLFIIKFNCKSSGSLHVVYVINFHTKNCLWSLDEFNLHENPTIEYLWKNMRYQFSWGVRQILYFFIKKHFEKSIHNFDLITVIIGSSLSGEKFRIVIIIICCTRSVLTILNT